jgi:hypothetical protein
MGKKEFLNKEENPAFPEIAEGKAEPGGIKAKVALFVSRILAIIKLALGICLLPFVYSTSAAFSNQLSAVDATAQSYFWAGLAAFMIIYLFIWEPKIIYLKGQRILELIFSFFKPLVKVAPYLLPIYTIILFWIYWVLSFIVKHEKFLYDFIFLFGLSVGIHLVFSAKSLRSKQGDFLKANYIFGFSFVYIINVALVAFCFNLIFAKYSLVAFCNDSFQLASNILSAAFKQLFLL